MRGARYLAEERGAFEAEPAPDVPLVAECSAPARAPLYEHAAAHDGQPALDWLRVFMIAWRADVE